MSESKTRITTFGYKHGKPPSADRVYDVHGVPDEDHDAEQAKADMIAGECTPGDHIAIGCTHGQYTSVGISRLVKKRLEDEGHDVTITHRDLKDEYVLHPLTKKKDVVAENVKTYRHKGMSEVDAIAKAQTTDKLEER